MRMKQVLNYLGEDTEALNLMAASRCSGGAGGSENAGGLPSNIACPTSLLDFNVTVVENSAFIQNARRNNYVALHDGLFWMTTNYDGGYKNLTAYDACTGALVKDVNTFTSTGRYLSGQGMEIDSNGTLWTQLVTAGVAAEPLWLNFDTVTDVSTPIIPKDGAYRTDVSNIVNDTANTSVWINKSGTLIRRNVDTSAETTAVTATSSMWGELDVLNYRMWVIHNNASLGDIKVYDAATGALATTITTTSPEDPYWSFYNGHRKEMLISCYHPAGSNVFVYDTDTYALKTTKNTSDYGVNEAGRIIGYIKASSEYVMMLENTSTGITQLVFLDGTTLAVNDAFTTTALSGDASSTYMLALQTDDVSVYIVVSHTDYTNNRLIRVVRP